MSWTIDIRHKKGSEAVSLTLGFGLQQQEMRFPKLRWKAADPEYAGKQEGKL